MRHSTFIDSVLLVLKSLRTKALVVIPLVAMPLTAQAHDFSTSFLNLEPAANASELQWQWRFTEHDLEVLLGTSEPTAALPALPQWLTLGSSCKLEPVAEFEQGVFAGERTITFRGTAPCAYSPDLQVTAHLIHHRLPDHKILR
ncbi:hypothetical protein J6I75_04625 [Pseudidiomarina sp. 1APP75-27a]|uniref:hypothetical protein n=1 Tax=Pseudidiomarina terrestris TaxID=2820060 RepID=UPI002B05997E|nr:hypothetical protein [Pseudidiomarina sp. 1APP75-27a]MEA3587628.1 hypothetical protein [Pseudidiomarina sp. 1APP75-27a]